jgi:hypothetical protein
MILGEECRLLLDDPVDGSPSPPDVCVDFWTSAYAAIDD